MNGSPPSPPGHILPAAGAGASPHNPRKRTSDEVYLPSRIAYTSPPCSSESSNRPSTAPEQNILQQMVAQSSFEQTGFGAFRPSRESTSSIYTHPTIKPESVSASANTTLESTITFQDALKTFQVQLDEEYKRFELSLNERDQNVDLEEFDWDELEARYHAEIDPKVEAEQEIMNECSHLFQHFLIWMHVSSEREADRALKRLRTRLAYVQNSEEKLGEKKAHYSKVVNAFHNAMALLGNI